MNKQLVRGPGGEQMVLLPEKEYDHLVAAAEDLADLIAMTEFDRKIELGEEEFVPERIVEQIFDGENLIRVWREYRGLSLTELASATKLLDDELAEIETDQQSPTVEQLKAIAKALKVTMDDLVR